MPVHILVSQTETIPISHLGDGFEKQCHGDVFETLSVSLSHTFGFVHVRLYQVRLHWDTLKFHSADVIQVQSTLSHVGFGSTKLQFLSLESQTSPAAMPDMEGT